jgi:hypothetical protein
VQDNIKTLWLVFHKMMHSQKAEDFGPFPLLDLERGQASFGRAGVECHHKKTLPLGL